jgi:hypothetical protein
MTRMLTVLGAVLAAIAAEATPAFAVPPSANGTVQEVSASVQVTGDGSTASATATCPPGTKAAGGGFDAPPTAQAVGIVYESVKVHERDWRASVQLLDPGSPETVTLTTYAYCRDHFPATHTSEQTVPTDGQVQLGPTASATCPHGEAALAGGFSMPPPLVSSFVTDLFFDSVRDGISGWDGRVVTGPAGPSYITSQAYCSAARDVPVEADGTTQSGEVDGVSSTATANCPPGLVPADGGFTQPASGLMSFFFVTSSRRVGGSWQVTGRHSGSVPQVPLQAAAYCA